MHHRFLSAVDWASGKQKSQDAMKQNTKLALNAHERIDWVLQDPLNVIGEAGELLQALSSHGCYMENVDVAAFIKARSDIFEAEKKEKGVTDEADDKLPLVVER